MDLRGTLLPDRLTLTLIPLGLITAWLNEPSTLVDHLIGAIVGFAGAACLTAAAARLFPFARQLGPAVLMLVAGGLLGTLLEAPMRSGSGFLDWLALVAPWQAGYAAAFATALPAVGAAER